MPENHEHSRYIYNSYYYDGHRLDVSDLDLKAYIDERIAASGGGSSYLVYKVFLNQSGTNAPTVFLEIENTLGVTITWSRFSIGRYRGTRSAGNFSSKTICPPFSPFTANNRAAITVWTDATMVGYYIIDATSNIITLDCYNAAGNRVDLNTLFGDTTCSLLIYVEEYV